MGAEDISLQAMHSSQLPNGTNFRLRNLNLRGGLRAGNLSTAIRNIGTNCPLDPLEPLATYTHKQNANAAELLLNRISKICNRSKIDFSCLVVSINAQFVNML